jgi:hypothetical protein
MAEKRPRVLPSWWNAKQREACIKIAKTMYHWDDLPEASAPKETNEWRRYNGPDMRLPLRMLGMKVEGIDMLTAVAMGYLNVHEGAKWQLDCAYRDYEVHGNIKDRGPASKDDKKKIQIS